jgi:hypothetical protein
MDTSTPSLADIAAVTKDNDMGGSGGWLWIIVLFLFMFGAGWNRSGGQDGQAVTESGLCNAMNFNNLENAVGRLSDQTQTQTQTLGNGISSLGYETLRNFADTQASVKDGDYALAQQIASCCCTTQRAIDGVNTSAAMNTAAINENTTAQVQKVLDAISQSKVDALQGQVQQLQLQSALCGVVRYPSATTYNAGFSPFYGGYGTSFAA